MNSLNESREKIKCIDGLKGIGAFIIAFFWHYQHFGDIQVSPFENVFVYSYKYGWSMVEVFFMLSGFGMMAGYSDKILSHRISFKDFFIKRLCKIYPLFLISTIITSVGEVLYKVKFGTTFVYEHFDMQHFFMNILLVQTGYFGVEFSINGVAWFLSVCMFCYIVFYFVLNRVKEKQRLFYSFTALAVLGLAIIKLDAEYPLINYLMGRGIAAFSMGVLIYGIYSNRNRFNSELLGLICLVVTVYFYLLVRFKPEAIGDFQMSFLMCASPAMIIAALLLKPVNAILGAFPFRYLGKISMPIFLLHFPIQLMITLIDDYCDLNIDYSSIIVWGIYAVSVLVIAGLYERFLSERVKSFFTVLLFRKKVYIQKTGKEEKT